MRNWTKFMHVLFRVTTLCLVLVHASCGGGGDDPEPSEADRVRSILKGTWNVQTVSVDNTDQTTLYENLTLTFTDAAYSTTNGGKVWPASGGWTFTDETATTILRSDDLIIDIEEATSARLVLSLYWGDTTIGPGRIESIKGAHVFTFEK